MADRRHELYEICDRAGLTAGAIKATRRSMDSLIGDIRLKLVNELAAYIQSNFERGEDERTDQTQNPRRY